ncbi:lon-related putative ATP-dependent protease [Dongia mobilis]|uniref:endopeptidase La n=1 Tax=Dongia mobilis TaxID=578943 RepID=A0A4R6WW78_9PROT|nr:ATP-binding protein [Dongia mobilis]TDQ84450.1 lon-related putative ATP-dependent protease [Dongia mobilis]
MGKSLTPDQLFTTCDPDLLPGDTTNDLDELPGLIGQERAIEAVSFGIGLRRAGYNLYALGMSGTGKHSVIADYLRREAAKQPTPDDWCYVNNFADPQRPNALRLPAGRAGPLRDAMRKLVEELTAVLPATFESEDYRARREVINEQFKQQSEQAFGDLQERAKARQIALIRTPVGLALAPLKGGEVLPPEEFEKLPEPEQKKIREAIETLQGQLEALVRRIPDWERKHREAVRALNHEVTKFAVDHLIQEVRNQYGDLPEVLAYLADVERDLVENAGDFMPQMQPGMAAVGAEGGDGPGRAFRRYQVNVLVEHEPGKGAPIYYEDRPNHQMIVGRVEHIARFGTLTTDFTLLKPGALHKANGGYLILDAVKLLGNGFAYESLKRALRAGEIRIETIEQMLSLATTISLEPEAIPLDLKIVLVGEAELYHMLHAYDPDFAELFKVPVDFEERIDRSSRNTILMARLIATSVKREKLRPFNRSGMARVIEQASRMVEDAQKLSVHMRSLNDLLVEADHHAGLAGATEVDGGHVQQAIDAQRRWLDRIPQRLREEMLRGTYRIETSGQVVGQINGLSVFGLGGRSFGRPSRISARVRVGRGELIDIEREVELGGPLHSKGVLILSGFLGGRFGLNRPLALGASLVFEQSYGGVEGDSASMAELCALMSALSDLPIRQGLAMTGSVDQSGQSQAIGGVNEKIEGFFELCAARGLTGEQGVIIPASNVKHLMLREAVVAAVRRGEFHIHAIDHVDEALEILTGEIAGSPGADGSYPPGTINAKAAKRLADFAERAAAFGRKLEPGRGA